MKIQTLFLALTMMTVPVLCEAAEYKLLATSKTATMEKEMNEAAANGYAFASVRGGKTGGGAEVVVIMSKSAAPVTTHVEYRLLATSKTSTMEKELQQASDAGYQYRDQSVFESAFGGDEVVVILERNRDAPSKLFEYKLLATSRTSTMEKELQAAAGNGFEFVQMTLGKTSFGGDEIVAIMRKQVPARQ